MWLSGPMMMLGSFVGLLGDEPTQPGSPPNESRHTIQTTAQAVAAKLPAERSLPAGKMKAGPFSDWLSRLEYQKLFQARIAQGEYPAEVEGRAADDGPQFRARFSSRPQEQPFPLAVSLKPARVTFPCTSRTIPVSRRHATGNLKKTLLLSLMISLAG